MKKTIKVCGVIFAIYIVFVTALYFLMGEQLLYRNSRGNIKMPEKSFSLAEVNKDCAVEQNFSVNINRLAEISLRWSALSRTNEGTVKLSLKRLDNGEILGEQTLNAADITDGFESQIKFEPYIEDVYGIPLNLTATSDSEPGSCVALMLGNKTENCSVISGGLLMEAALCFSASGLDYIWTGKNYWIFALIGAGIIAAVIAVVLIKLKRGKKSHIVNVYNSLTRYKFLISQLVSRDFKSKYKRSFFGVLWSFFNPLLTSLVMYVVFSNLFRFNVPHYPVYLISGTVMFNFFSECCGMCLTSIVGNAPLITKVYVPKYVYPFTRTLSSGINLAFAFIPVLIIALINGLVPTKAWLLALFPLACLMIFCLGFGLILCTTMVFFRDTQFLWGVISMIWMYITPIFYPIDILPDNLLAVLKCNPLYYYVDFVRSCIIGGISPEPRMYVQCFLIAVGFLIFGSLIFKLNQDKFVLYL